MNTKSRAYEVASPVGGLLSSVAGNLFRFVPLGDVTPGMVELSDQRIVGYMVKVGDGCIAVCDLNASDVGDISGCVSVVGADSLVFVVKEDGHRVWIKTSDDLDICLASIAAASVKVISGWFEGDVEVFLRGLCTVVSLEYDGERWLASCCVLTSA